MIAAIAAPRRRRSLVPRSLALRIFAILTGGIIATSFITRWVVEQMYHDELQRLGRSSAIERIADAVRVLDALPRAARQAAGEGIAFERMRVSWSAVPVQAEAETEVLQQLQQSIRRPLAGLRFDALPPLPCSDDTQADCSRLANRFVAELKLADGQPVRIEYTTRFFDVSKDDYLPWLITVVLIVLLVWLSVRIATRPLRDLANHAAALGQNLDIDPLSEDGPSEVRHAARAINAMQARIRRQLEERTQMLAAIAHDLKTPLTRQRLRIEQIGEEALRNKLEEDISAMRKLIDEGLELARSLDADETLQRVDLSALLDSLCEDTRAAGGEARYVGGCGLIAELPLASLRRVLGNLIDNAVQYGGGAELDARLYPERVEISVRDHGPGVPPEHLADILKPYFRLEASRSRETGGSGLGLAIASNLVAARRGSLQLRNHPQGGLEVLLTLPARTR